MIRINEDIVFVRELQKYCLRFYRERERERERQKIQLQSFLRLK